MSIFRRLSATVASRIDQVVGEIENHDAVAQATIKDMRKKVAEAKVRLAQLQREVDRTERQISEQNENAERWRKRAIEVAANDEGKALECVNRRRHCQQQVEVLTQGLSRYRQGMDKLAHDIHSAEQRLGEVQQKANLMRARQSTSAALHATSDSNVDITQLLEDTFDRWEINITQAEMAINNSPQIDPIEHEFVKAEEKDLLRSELSAILAQQEQEEKQ